MQPILDRALDLPVENRHRWLDAACADDPSLRPDIERLLQEDASTGGILDNSADPFLRLALAEREVLDDTARARFIPGVVLAGRYRVVTRLGSGGMGEVYRADDLKLGQPVALKFLAQRWTENAALLTSLLREARIARQVSHPNVCRVYDVAEADGHTFLTMEYIDGEDLRSLLRRIGQLPHQKALDIARQLCAGLQAAHELGVLHRDLKPANVMLDARGRARITDFGIAAVTGERASAEMLAGTPAYMAPELLDRQAASVGSDIYALGLILYELFTGTRAIDVTSLEELRRVHDSTPVTPGSLVDNLDPRIERAILSCIEHDPELRPRSARAVAATLPGGDPIAAAAEAGETPSPELVAASGPEGSLSPAVAFGTLGVLVAALCVLLLIWDRASVLGWVQFSGGPDVLEDHARGTLRRLGHGVPPVDRAMSVTALNDRYRRYVRAHDLSPRRWDTLRQSNQWDVLFWYRQSANALTPWNPDGDVYRDDPAEGPGDAQVLTDVGGRLIWLLVQPDQIAPPEPNTTSPDWAAVFREADLDLSTFRPVAPTLNPTVTADVRVAWSGTAPNAGGYPVRVEAAAYRGKPVYFEQVVPWDPYWDPSNVRQATASLTVQRTMMARVLAALSLVVMPIAAIGLVVRNWLNGRGDRTGALRLAMIVFGLRFTTWLLGAHHVPSLREEWIVATIAVSKSLFDAAAAWGLYLAIEPYARRVHPRFLVSWTRLLRGRWRDPLVGRDILFGITLSTITVACWALPVILPHALGHNAPPPPMFFPLGNLPYLLALNPPPAQPLLGGRHALAALPGVGLTTIGLCLVFLVVLLALSLLLRRFWLALVLFAPIMLVVNPGAEAAGYTPISLAASFAAALSFAWTLRFGLVGAIAQRFGVMLWLDFPMTAKVNAPHFATSLFAMAVIVAIALYGALIATRRKSPAGSRRVASL